MIRLACVLSIVVVAMQAFAVRTTGHGQSFATPSTDRLEFDAVVAFPANSTMRVPCWTFESNKTLTRSEMANIIAERLAIMEEISNQDLSVRRPVAAPVSVSQAPGITQESLTTLVGSLLARIKALEDQARTTNQTLGEHDSLIRGAASKDELSKLAARLDELQVQVEGLKRVTIDLLKKGSQ